MRNAARWRHCGTHACRLVTAQRLTHPLGSLEPTSLSTTCHAHVLPPLLAGVTPCLVRPPGACRNSSDGSCCCSRRPARRPSLGQVRAGSGTRCLLLLGCMHHLAWSGRVNRQSPSVATSRDCIVCSDPPLWSHALRTGPGGLWARRDMRMRVQRKSTSAVTCEQPTVAMQGSHTGLPADLSGASATQIQGYRCSGVSCVTE